MEKTYLKPSNVHEPFSNYSHGIVVEGAKKLIFCAGQVAGDKDGNIVGVGDFEAQQQQVISNLRNVLAEAGATLEDVVRVTVYVVNQDDAQKGRNIQLEHFTDVKPATTICVIRGLADPRMLVEVEATAVVG